VTAVSWGIDDASDIRCDVSDEASVDAAFAQTVETYGTPTLAVAAAGVTGPFAPLHQIAVNEWDQTFAVNIRGVFLTVRAVARGIIREQLDGSIVLISSVNGTIADPGIAAYSATKAAVNHFARVAAVDLGSHAIRVNAVGPGPTQTAMVGNLAADPRWVAEVEAVTPLHRVGQPDDIGTAVVGIMQADWITGQVINVDGGASLMTARGKSRAQIIAGQSARDK
jgi:NAD(P)-dependent dehydrogenase (short-subunit alcohol dehydrogenase family)